MFNYSLLLCLFVHIDQAQFVWRAFPYILKFVCTSGLFGISILLYFNYWIAFQFGLELLIASLFLFLFHFESLNGGYLLTLDHLWRTEDLLFLNVFFKLLSVRVFDRLVSRILSHLLLSLLINIKREVFHILDVSI